MITKKKKKKKPEQGTSLFHKQKAKTHIKLHICGMLLGYSLLADSFYYCSVNKRTTSSPADLEIHYAFCVLFVFYYFFFPQMGVAGLSYNPKAKSCSRKHYSEKIRLDISYYM